ncbi:MAG TPA: methylmalonyl Co-A mutase-associated GTPase MeaB [Phycisphaerae bacterium]|nr:methylmalonyl Co-A mutase-associated GTPase MeaB [Phycisphaerae bacterium]
MKQAPIRVLLAKIGLDGHDRGVKVLAKTFRDAGMEVIYTGLWQTPSGTAKAAVEEDVDVCGASFHSAAHLTLVPILMDELRKRGRADMPVVIGGIIPHEDVPVMKEAGVAGVFEPEDSLEHIIDSVKKIGEQVRQARQAAWKKGALEGWATAAGRGDRTALGQMLTWVESEPPAAEVSRHLAPVGGETLIIGVTGAPGVGKSTLIGRLAKELSGRGKEVAVIAVDPASPITGGALLGDRARMTLAAEEGRIFLRSSASRGQLGGLAPSTGTMIQALTNAKIDVLIVETVGAGQSDIAVRQWARPLILVMMPGAGDDLQLAKAGITEVADLFVINKADLPGADRLQSQIRDTLGTKRPVVKTVASHGKGIAELADALFAR